MHGAARSARLRHGGTTRWLLAFDPELRLIPFRYRFGIDLWAGGRGSITFSAAWDTSALTFPDAEFQIDASVTPTAEDGQSRMLQMTLGSSCRYLLGAACCVLVASACGGQGSSAVPAISTGQADALVRLAARHFPVLTRAVHEAAARLSVSIQSCSALRQGTRQSFTTGAVPPSARELLVFDAVQAARAVEPAYRAYQRELSALHAKGVSAFLALVAATATIEGALTRVRSEPFDVCAVLERWRRTGFAPSFPIAKQLKVSDIFANDGQVVSGDVRRASFVIERFGRALQRGGTSPAAAARFRVITNPLGGLG